ncbi:hypothetical protein K435DRAFT_422206 [Dendrothele bispora CBS 962.96]|uniref:Uncharacterized protein n=1 Tax=Dendrothele bispora (strain CBS 962.96) TaxID=1314807 RepID=A0A4S8MEN8_DENBC|nr:hypothetical protein K435DRAFT_422206 [Dendrothele bispora CBS 962.96]
MTGMPTLKSSLTSRLRPASPIQPPETRHLYVKRAKRPCLTDEVEDKVHAILCCEGDPDLVYLHNIFMLLVLPLLPDASLWHTRHTEQAFLFRLIFDERLLKIVASLYTTLNVSSAHEEFMSLPLLCTPNRISLMVLG